MVSESRRNLEWDKTGRGNDSHGTTDADDAVENGHDRATDRGDDGAQAASDGTHFWQRSMFARRRYRWMSRMDG